MRIATLLTCFNRKDKTCACLESLFKYAPDVDVFLVDDGSKDGTSEIVSIQFPKVHVIHGDGNLFWTRGMYVAWREALKGNYDYYIWLNDDTILSDLFLDELLECNKLGGGHCIITGLIADITTKKLLYGCVNKRKQLEPLDGKMHKVYYMHGNIVLVPKSVVDTIGIIDPKLHHGGGDTDYGLTALEAGIPVFGTRVPIGYGYPNRFDRLRKWNTNLVGRFKFLFSPIGNDPRLAFYLTRKHFGLFRAIMVSLYVIILNLPPDWLAKIIWSNHYNKVNNPELPQP